MTKVIVSALTVYRLLYAPIDSGPQSSHIESVWRLEQSGVATVQIIGQCCYIGPVLKIMLLHRTRVESNFVTSDQCGK